MNQEAERLRYLTYIQASGSLHPTWNMEKYYTEMSTRTMTALRDKTVKDLERNPNFAAKFYTEFVEYLNSKLSERRTLKDWIWRNTILKVNLAIWRWRNERTNPRTC